MWKTWRTITVLSSSTENYTLLSRVRNKPYDVFGCWLNETHLISGNLHWIGNMTSCSVLWLNKAFQVGPLHGQNVMVGRGQQFLNNLYIDHFD